ncbi:MAG: hypothetical protein NWE93_08235 [Candidatus Bathyarchaeota archaeon]|nr:hypothetical protein [Candidatus Bathyarchaeota archaeon]
MVALGVLVGAYVALERRRGDIQARMLSIKSNLTVNSLYVVELFL